MSWPMTANPLLNSRRRGGSARKLPAPPGPSRTLTTLLSILIAGTCVSCGSKPAGGPAAAQPPSKPAPAEPASDPSAPPESTAASLFGFASPGGDHVFAIGTVANPKQLIRAVCKGQSLTIQYSKRSSEFGPADKALGFKEPLEDGYLYQVTSGKAAGNAFCLAAGDDFFRARASLAVTPAPPGKAPGEAPTCSGDSAAAISKVKSRRVEGCWDLARIGTANARIVKFERKGTDALASFVLVDGGTMIFNDYPAKYNASSTWRVDDGGEFYPNFNVLFAFRNGKAVELGLEWMGAEGSSLSLIRSEGDTFQTVLKAYRYLVQ